MADPRKTSLAVGATGMLAGALDRIAAGSARTLVVARNASATLARRPLPRAEALDLDWRDAEAFVAGVEARLGDVDLALLWIHSSGAASLAALLERLTRGNGLIVHVLSSAAGDPAAYRSAITDRATDGRARYVTVKLGRISDGPSWRWLTDGEISAGAIEAMQTERDVVVGELP